MKRIIFILMLCTLAGVSAMALQTGDEAAPLKTSKWLLNGPIAINEGRKSENKDAIFILELWGTWSPQSLDAMPLLVYLQNKYRAKGLKIIAISRESEDVVKAFLKKHPEINYGIALDDKSQTTLKYLGESRLLPRFYVINAKGEIIWDGEAADLASVLRKIYSGKYSSSAQEEISRMQQELELQMRRGMFDKVKEISDRILQIDPENGPAIRMRMFMYENQRRPDMAWDFLQKCIKKSPDYDRFYFVQMDFASRYPDYRKFIGQIGEEVFKRFNKEPDILNDMAWGLLTRFPDDVGALNVAAKCVLRVKELAEKEAQPAIRVASLNTLALLYYRCGLLDKALKTQKKVTSLLKEDSTVKKSKLTEQYYLKAIELNKQLSAL
ncbi:TlpA disulfide reductase family protein [Lentisphaerota bacterium ZTH]|nr:TlpA family protein disulfide reductase [Lentisphaerota bacterium]WET05635.1 TlpA disulfide reductase family protein [Lentisphaerota bacterium ZTH]